MLRLIFKDKGAGPLQLRTVDAIILPIEKEIHPPFGERSELVGIELIKGSCDICGELNCGSDHK